MKVSQLLGTTRREAPAHADLESYGLLERAGYLRPLASGLFSYLNLGQRSLRKIEQILREEMDRIGGVEICMPVVHPADIWKQTGRYDALDDSLVRFSDRSERPMVLAMTHEEVVSSLAHGDVTSYKQLPLMIYQIQTKVRDELRPRGGLLRTREFVMKDSYTLDLDFEGLQKQYEHHYDAYYRIFSRMGLSTVAIISDSGMMGGKMAHEFMYLTAIGEDTIFVCEKSGYKANKEVCAFKKEKVEEDALPMEEVETPGTSTIEDLAGFLGMPTSKMGKMVFYMARFGKEENEKLIAAVVRGDYEVNNIKLTNLVKADELRPATGAEIQALGGFPGYASPLGMDREKMMVVADESVTLGGNLVLGANKKDYHIKNVNYGRDYEADLVGDIVSAFEGATSVFSGEPLKAVRGVEAGNIFQLGTKYSKGLNALINDPNGKAVPIVMGSYGIGVGRALACLAEEYHDENGLKLPITIAPFHVNLILLPGNEEAESTANQFYQEMQNKGIEVLFDDRPNKMASPGVKFRDADLRGIPIHLTLSKRSLEKGGAELKVRKEGESRIVPVTEALAEVEKAIAALFQEVQDLVDAQPTWETEKHLWD